jgi:ABC-type enterochelin transport system permease subunit
MPLLMYALSFWQFYGPEAHRPLMVRRMLLSIIHLSGDQMLHQHMFAYSKSVK